MPDLIHGALEDFHAAQNTSATIMPGAIAAHRTVQQRRRTRLALFGVISVLAIAMPIAAFAANPRGNNSPPPAVAAAAPSAEPAPSEAAASPSASPAHSPDAALAPNGIFTREQLVGKSISIPSVEAICDTHNPVVLNKSHGQHGDVYLGYEIAYANLDNDPALETAVQVLCIEGDPGPQWLLALDRDTSGNIVVLGTITSTKDNSSMIKNLSAGTQEGLDVTVCVHCGSDPADSEWINRHFRWDGSKFTSSPQPAGWVTDLSIKSGNVSNVSTKDGRLTLTVTVTVTNVGNLPSQQFFADLIPGGGYFQEKVSISPGNAWISSGTDTWPALSDPLQPGESRSLTVTVTRDTHTADYDNLLYFRVLQSQGHGDIMRDPKPANDGAEVRYAA